MRQDSTFNGFELARQIRGFLKVLFGLKEPQSPVDAVVVMTVHPPKPKG